ncbi:MAG: helix-turn-helix transcriptional regulator [Lachnospiraceae bacterium]|jgi:AraC-like DNA-binding protein|nr:helix-turn-helix transcriptional regulator [Lachnospiraceae bacterium]MCH4071214.1 helix-turn-helix transcriptional regulator [Lachnospiraceae bacterium]MCH4108058.1 helix-turn-helix transcriptional regulator [Lachnospiraceae bacterium]MCI1302771.1 helix-turn-helix transcriptional regulator [Lachnospiraceae bacterium]MCI1332021.1 helix-turn-helix transcriptional regulator [Lachnospiraceae bacterium]
MLKSKNSQTKQKKIRRVGFHRRVTFVSMGLILILLITFSVTFFSYYSRRSDEQYAESAANTVDGIAQNLDRALQNTWNYYANLAQDDNDSMNYIMSETVSFERVSDILKAQRLLSGSNLVRDYVRAYAFVNRNTGKVITGNGVYSENDLGHVEEFAQLWQNRSLAYSGISFQWFKSENTGSTTVSANSVVPFDGLYLISFMPNDMLDPDCVLTVRLNLNQLWKDARNGLGSGQAVVIVDRNTGEVRYSSDNDFSSAVLAALQKQGSSESLSGKISGENTTYMTAESSLSKVSWDVYYGTNLHLVNKTADMFMLFSLVLLAIIVFGAVFLSFQMVYRPVSRMAGEISAESDTKLQPGEDELAYVADNISRLNARNVELKSQVQELFARRMLQGELTDADIDAFTGELAFAGGIPPAYRVVTIILRSTDEQIISDQKGKEIMLDIVRFCKEQGIGDSFFPPVTYMKSIVCLIPEAVSAADEEAPTDILSEPAVQLYKALVQYVNAQYGTEIGMGISRVERDIHKFHAVYRESVRALNSRHEVEEAAGVSRNHPNPGTESYYQFYMGDEQSATVIYNSEWTQKINQAIQQADKESAYEVVNKVTKSIREQGFSREAAATVLLQFVNSVIESAQENGIAIESVLRDSVDEIYKTVMNSVDLNYVRGYLKFKMIDPILFSVGENMTSQSHLILMSIEKMVEDNKGNITLAECAQALNYNPSYLWKILKQEKNMTFTEYTDSYRLGLAKDRLLNTSETVASIAEELGYTNAQNFIRFFSKMTGTTPGKFRKQFREQG